MAEVARRLIGDNGISANTQRGLASDSDLDRGLYQVEQGAAAQVLGVDPTQGTGAQKTFTEQTMTQEQRDAKIKRDRAEADANRLKQMELNRRRR